MLGGVMDADDSTGDAQGVSEHERTARVSGRASSDNDGPNLRREKPYIHKLRRARYARRHFIIVPYIFLVYEFICSIADFIGLSLT